MGQSHSHSSTNALAILLILLLGTLASGQTRDETWAQCSLDTAVPNPKIAACTALIDSGRETVADLTIALHNRATIFLMSEQHDKALADVSAVLTLEPREPHALFLRGLLKFIAQDFPSAEADRLAAHAVRRDIFIVMASRGLAWGRLTDPNTPERYQRLAEEYWDSAYRDTALTEREQRDYIDKGLQALNEALRLKPDYPEALLYKVMLMKLRASIEPDPKRQQAILDEADAIYDALRKLSRTGRTQ